MWHIIGVQYVLKEFVVKRIGVHCSFRVVKCPVTYSTRHKMFASIKKVLKTLR